MRISLRGSTCRVRASSPRTSSTIWRGNPNDSTCLAGARPRIHWRIRIRPPGRPVPRCTEGVVRLTRVGQRCEGLVGAGPEQAPPAATGWRDLAGVLHVLLPYYETKSETAIISFTRKRAGQLCGRGNTGCYHDDTASFLRCIWTNKSW